MGLAAVALGCAATGVLGAGCGVSVHVGYGTPPQAQQAYVAAIAPPMKALTAAASKTGQTCAGGSRPDPSRCYANTRLEIRDARDLERAMRSVPTPSRFVRANKDLLHALDVFIHGLIQRNEGLAAHSPAEYMAGSKLITKGLNLQRAAIAEYPADAHIST